MRDINIHQRTNCFGKNLEYDPYLAGTDEVILKGGEEYPQFRLAAAAKKIRQTEFDTFP